MFNFASLIKIDKYNTIVMIFEVACLLAYENLQGNYFLRFLSPLMRESNAWRDFFHWWGDFTCRLTPGVNMLVVVVLRSPIHANEPSEYNGMLYRTSNRVLNNGIKVIILICMDGTSQYHHHQHAWRESVRNSVQAGRAVANLTVPGGQEFHFPHFFPKFRSLIFLKLSSFSSSKFWLSGWASRPPGKA